MTGQGNYSFIVSVGLNWPAALKGYVWCHQLFFGLGLGCYFSKHNLGVGMATASLLALWTITTVKATVKINLSEIYITCGRILNKTKIIPPQT